MFMRHHPSKFALAAMSLLVSSAVLAGPTPNQPSAGQIFTAENPNPVFVPSTPDVSGYVLYGEAISNQFAEFKKRLVPGVMPFDFEIADPNSTDPISFVFGGSNGSSIEATLTGGLVRDTTVLGRYNTTQPTAGTPQPRRYLEVQTAATPASIPASGSAPTLTPTGQFTISFDKAISAFAFFGTDIGDFDGSLIMEMYLNGAKLTELTVRSGDKPAANGNELLFYGFASPDVAYDKIIFRTVSTNGNDVFGFDDFWAGDAGQLVAPTPAPEPGSLALVGLALAAAGLMRRRKA